MQKHRRSTILSGRIAASSRSLITALFCTGAISLTAQAELTYEAWVNRFGAVPAAIEPTSKPSTAVDERGNFAIAACVFINNSRAYYTAKYSGLTGKLLWEKTHNTGGDDIPHAITFDSLGNVIVTGGSTLGNNGLDYYTVKYAAGDGHILWDSDYNNAASNGRDEALAVAVDSSDNVIVTGRSIGSSDDIYTVKYAASTGAQLSEYRYTSAGTRSDYPTDLALDNAGNPIVGGVTTTALGGTDIYVAKLNMAASAGTETWSRTIASATSHDDEGKAVAVDAQNNVIITGILANPDNSHSFYTRKYSSTGTTLWSQQFNGPVADFNGPSDVAVDSKGNVIVTGTSTLNNFKVTYYTAKYNAGDGSVLWDRRSEIPGADATTFQDDAAAKIVVDLADNPIITGTSQNEDVNDDYYTVKYDGNTGVLLWANRLNGDNESGADTAAALAVDKTGSVAVVGVSREAQGANFQILTVKYGRFIVAQKDSAPFAGYPDSGIPEGATISAVSVPAIADNGNVATRVTVAAGKKKFGGVFLQGVGLGTYLPAVQNDLAPGLNKIQLGAGKSIDMKSFLDPILAPNGRLAFITKLSNGTNGVWTNLFGGIGDSTTVLAGGSPVPGMPEGTVVQSVLTISVRNGQLLALIKVKGSGVNAGNSTVLQLLTSPTTGRPLLRTGDPLTVGDTESDIKSITVLNPAAGSTGYGRYQTNDRVIARVTLADKRSVVVTVTPSGIVAPLLYTNQPATTVASEAVWKSFGLPAVGQITLNNFRYVAAGTLQQGAGDVTKANDTALVYSANGTTFTPFAREGQAAPQAGGATYASFLDPLVNDQGDVAFVASLQGTGVKKNNKAGIWWGAPNAVELVARTGDPQNSATNADGESGEILWSSFTSTTLTGGPAGAPVFQAKVSGPGVTPKNNIGVWAVDSTGLVRQLLRTGDNLGDLTVAGISLLQASPGTFGAARSYNADGSVVLLVKFTNKTQAVMQIAVP